jgi:hypothetical protein
MISKSLRSEYLHSIEHYDFTTVDLKSILLYGIIVGVLISTIFLTYLFILDIKDGKYNGHIKACLSLCKRYKADTLLPIDMIKLKKAKESPFIGPYQTTMTPILPNLDDSNTTFRFRGPFKQEISFYEPETRITILVENTPRS